MGGKTGGGSVESCSESPELADAASLPCHSSEFRVCDDGYSYSFRGLMR